MSRCLNNIMKHLELTPFVVGSVLGLIPLVAVKWPEALKWILGHSTAFSLLALSVFIASLGCFWLRKLNQPSLEMEVRRIVGWLSPSPKLSGFFGFFAGLSISILWVNEGHRFLSYSIPLAIGSFVANWQAGEMVDFINQSLTSQGEQLKDFKSRARKLLTLGVVAGLCSIAGFIV